MPAPARVLFVHPSDEMYGADRILLEVLEALPGGVEAEVWLPEDLPYPEHRLSRELVRRGVTTRTVALPVLRRDYLRAAALPALAWRWARTAIRLLRRRPSLVYLNTSACLPVAPLAWLARVPVVLHLHEAWGAQERRLLAPLARPVRRVVAVSAAVAGLLPPRLRGRTVVVHNGLPVDPSTRDRAAAELPAGPMTFLVASRWNAWKGQRELLAAWARLHRSDARLVVLGGPPPAGPAVDVPGLVAALPDPTTVEVVGEVEDATPYLLAADCVVVPSTRPDPLPTIALEAAALSRPVLASDDGGLREIVADGVTGLLLPPGDAEAWARALDGLSRARARELGGAGRERFDRLFSAERFRAEVRGVLAEGLGG